MPRAYVYVESGVRDDLGHAAHALTATAKGVDVQQASTFAQVGKGASIGASVGSAVPIPAVGTTVGTIVGGITGLGISLFGGGKDEAKLRGILPIMLKAALKKKGAASTFHYARSDYKYGAKKGLRVTGKAFDPQRILQLTKELNVQLAREGTHHSQADARKYNGYLHVSKQRPSSEHQIIVSFPAPTPTSEAVTNAQKSTPSKSNGRNAVYIIGIGAAVLYAVSR